MPTSAPGSSRPARRHGFTLLELLVVVAIVAVASAGVSLVLRDSATASLEREAQRLAALLESARAQSRLTGLPVRWIATEDSFRFEGLPPETVPEGWLDTETRAPARTVLVLGPDPIIGPQEVVLTRASQPDRTLRVMTDGLRPFAVSASE